MASEPRKSALKSSAAARQRGGIQKRSTGLSDVVDEAKTNRLEEIEAARRKKRFVAIVKVVIKNVALLAANVGILVGGAIIFKHLEFYNEQEGCYASEQEYLKARTTVEELLLIGAGKYHSKEIKTSKALTTMYTEYNAYIREFANQVQKIKYPHTLNCADPGSDANWSFSNSLVFALTVITTIGYGVIAPATTNGRLFCIAYAIIGISVYMIALASVGDILAKMFRKVYFLACCCGCFRKKEKKLTMLSEDPEKDGSAANKTNESSDSKDKSKEDEEDEFTIPLTISFGVLVIAVLVGAIIFQLFEKSWQFLESVYYSFTTISTIGFGDVVPSIDVTNINDIGKLAAMIVYITVGMAAISMCFQLMADEIVAKFIWISTKCGIRKTESEDGGNGEVKRPTMKRIGTKMSLHRSKTNIKMKRSESTLTSQQAN